jgi:sporulation protein YlmC with PRC-barrel domain
MAEAEVGRIVTVQFNTGKIDGVLVAINEDSLVPCHVFCPRDAKTRIVNKSQIVSVGAFITIPHNSDDCE